MKSILLLVAVCGLLFTACKKEEAATFSVEVTPKTFNETTSAADSKSMTAKITNTSTVAGTVNWSFTETQTVDGWTYNIVTNNTAQSGTTGSFELAAGGSIDVKVTAQPNGNAGTSKAQLVFKNEAAELETVSYTVEATGTVSVPKFSLSTNSESGTASVQLQTTAEYKTILKNLTANELNLTWSRVDDTNNPSSWNISVCDNVCRPPSVLTHSFTIPANGEINLKVDFNTGGTTGTGKSTIDIYETGNTSTTQQFVVEHTAN